MKETLAELAPHATRITATQSVWLNDTKQQTDYLALHGHDEAHHGAKAWARACQQAAPLLKALNSNITQPWEWRHTLTYLHNTDPGLRNQIIQGATLRAGLVIGTVTKCVETGCQGWIPVGREHCQTCQTHIDLAGHPRCTICTELLDPHAPADQTAHKACRKAAERGQMLGPSADRCLSGKRHRLLMRPGATSGPCIRCRQIVEMASSVG